MFEDVFRIFDSSWNFVFLFSVCVWLMIFVNSLLMCGSVCRVVICLLLSCDVMCGCIISVCSVCFLLFVMWCCLLCVGVWCGGVVMCVLMFDSFVIFLNGILRWLVNMCMICVCNVFVGSVCNSGFVLNSVFVWFFGWLSVLLVIVLFNRNCDSGIVCLICLENVFVLNLCM